MFSYPLLSTGCEPVMRGAIGSLYTAEVPSIVTDTLTPRERGTATGGNIEQQVTENDKLP